jgi:molybdopterin converting factor small subunit
MSISLRLCPTLANYSNNIDLISVNGKTVKDCLDDLVTQFPKVSEMIFDTHGKLQSYISVFINQKNAYPDELKKSVKDGDEIVLLLVISGG